MMTSGVCENCGKRFDTPGHPNTVWECKSPTSPACSLPIPEPTALQVEAVQELLDQGGNLVLQRIMVAMPDGDVANVDCQGRIYWQ